MNAEELIYLTVLFLVIGLIGYGVWWVCSRAYYYYMWGTLDPRFREKD